MRVEKALLEGKTEELLLTETSSQPVSKKKRRRQKKSSSSSQMPNTVMRLFRACKDVFSTSNPGIVPSQEDLDRIKSILDRMKLADLNLSPQMPYFKQASVPNGKSPITYLHVYECSKFSIGIFCLPPSSAIPLHNHPGMTVLSKILYGTMHIKSYDWVDVPDESSNVTADPNLTHLVGQTPEVRLAKAKTDANFTSSCGASILYPTTGGNIHCFTAVTACVVLDVLGPPYSDSEGRHCTYYNVFPYENFSDEANESVVSDGEEYAWLEAKGKPEDFVVNGDLYTGPRLAGH